MHNGSSVGICTHRMHVFCTFGDVLYAQSVLIGKTSASEVSQKFIKSALLVGLLFSFTLLEQSPPPKKKDASTARPRRLRRRRRLLQRRVRADRPVGLQLLHGGAGGDRGQGGTAEESRESLLHP